MPIPSSTSYAAKKEEQQNQWIMVRGMFCKNNALFKEPNIATIAEWLNVVQVTATQLGDFSDTSKGVLLW
ncbi:MAG TPA: hypothetical protein VFB72_19880 [Verrucomicrobiae bacterium]|nr:hypothetical protein [Verrucomicrobiae bacterium]